MSMRKDPRDKRRAVAWVVIGGGLLIGAVSFGLASSHAAETAVMVPPAAMTETTGPRGHVGESRARRRLLLGRAGACSSTSRACATSCRAMPAATRRPPAIRRSAPARPATPNPSRSRSIRAQINYGDHPADLFLGGPRPDPAQSPGARHGHAVPLGDLLPPTTRRRRSPGPISPNSTARSLRAPDRDQHQPHSTASTPAEAYHQDYATLHPDNPYIAYNDLPKVENLSRLFPQLYQQKPRLVSEAALAD